MRPASWADVMPVNAVAVSAPKAPGVNAEIAADESPEACLAVNSATADVVNCAPANIKESSKRPI